jgi:hypothetical protein
MRMRPLHNAATFLFIALALALTSQGLTAGEHTENTLRVEAKLIWGTNDETSPDPNHKKLNSDLARKLKKTFKWENYFEITRKTVDLRKGESKSIKLSDECTVVVTNLGGTKAKVELFGKGKLVQTKECTIAEKDLVIGGDDKNNTAWFVVVREGGAEKP